MGGAIHLLYYSFKIETLHLVVSAWRHGLILCHNTDNCFCLKNDVCVLQKLFNGKNNCDHRPSYVK